MRNFLFIILFLLNVSSNSIAELQLDGTNDYLNLGNTLHYGMPVTQSIWVKAANFTNFAWIFFTDKGISGNCNSFHSGYWLWFNATQVQASYGSNTECAAPSRITAAVTYNFKVNTWYHLTAVYTSSSNIQVYINGLPQTESYSGSGGAPAFTSYPASIGVDCACGGAPTYGSVSVADVAFWDIGLTATEASVLASSRLNRMPLQIRPDHLKMYVPLDDYSAGVVPQNGTFKNYGIDTITTTSINEGVSLGENNLSYP